MEIERQRSLELFNLLKNKSLRFNPISMIKQTHSIKDNKLIDYENSFDPHLEIVKKVDALIALNEKETWSKEAEVITKLKNNYWE